MHALDSPKKWTNELGFFLPWRGKKQKNKKTKFICSFFGRFYSAQICLRFYLTFSICTIWKILFWHIVWTVHVLFTLPLQSLKIIFVKNTLVLLAVVAKGVDWGRVGLKKSTPYHNFRAICIILLLRKKVSLNLKSRRRCCFWYIYLHMYI